MRPFLMSAIVCTLLFARESPAAGQVLPFPREDMSTAAREYQAEVLREAQTVITEWHEAWARRDTRALLRLYTSDALLIVPDASVAPLQGGAAIQAHLDENWATTGTIRFGLASAEASGRLLYLSGRFFVEGVQRVASGRTVAPPQPRSGTFVAVLQRQGRSWRIRAQVFRPDGEATE